MILKWQLIYNTIAPVQLNNMPSRLITLKKTTIRPVLSGHSKRRPKLFLKTDYRLMQVKSIAECSKGSILQFFRPSLSYHLSLKSLFCLFLIGRLRQGLLYKIYFLLWHTVIAGLDSVYNTILLIDNLHFLMTNRLMKSTTKNMWS